MSLMTIGLMMCYAKRIMAMWWTVQRTRTCAWYLVHSLYPRRTPHARKRYVNARLACQRASSSRSRTGGFEDRRHRGSRSCCTEPSSFLVLLDKLLKEKENHANITASPSSLQTRTSFSVLR
jgi:hypothetical protein